MTERDEATHIAGALEAKVHDVFDRNDRLEAECASLRVAFDAVSQENEALRKALEQRTRQRDGARRTADLLDVSMRKAQAIINDAVLAIHPATNTTNLPETPAANLKLFQKPMAQ